MHLSPCLQIRRLDSKHSGKINRGEVTAVVKMKLQVWLTPVNAT